MSFNTLNYSKPTYCQIKRYFFYYIIRLKFQISVTIQHISQSKRLYLRRNCINVRPPRSDNTQHAVLGSKSKRPYLFATEAQVSSLKRLSRSMIRVRDSA